MTLLNEIEEKQLLKAVAGGDEQAFSTLFRHYHPFLAEHLLRLKHSPQMVEEILHDVFLKIWLTREALEKVGNFKSYLYIVSRNHALNTLRKLAKEYAAKSEYIQNQQLYGEPPDDEQKALKTAIIEDAIDSLPERQKQVYLLHRDEGLTYAQIADLLGIGRETVKTHLEKAVRGIKQFIIHKMTALILFSDFL